MSAVEQLKVQLHQVSTDASQAAGGLAGFETSFSESIAQVQALIAGTATHADRDITELLDAASQAVKHAVDSLQTAAHGCADYANQI